MEESKLLEIELPGADAEEIISAWIAAKMKEQGYELAGTKILDGPWPDTLWTGRQVDRWSGKI